MRRQAEIQAVIDKANLWKAFLDTAFKDDLWKFFDEQEKLGREGSVDLLISGEYEKAKAAAHKVSGVLSVREYIHDVIETGRQVIETEKADRDYSKEIPSHV